MGFFQDLFKPNVVRLAEKKDVNGLLSALNHADYQVRSEAQDALVLLGDTAFTPLMSALQNPDTEAKDRIVTTLGRMRDPRAVEPFIRLLETDDGTLLTAVIGALGNIGDPRAVDPLVTLLRTSVRPKQVEIIEALAKIGDASAIAPLTCMVRKQYPYDCHADVRRSAAIALGRLSGPKAVLTLSYVLDDPDREVRRGAVAGLKYTGDPHAFDPVVTELKSPDYDTRMRAVEAFKEIEEAGLNALFPLLDDSDDWISGDEDNWIKNNNRGDVSGNETGYVYITAFLVYNICMRDPEKNKVLQLMKSLLDTSSSSGDREVSRLKEMVTGSGTKGLMTFFFCALDAFSLRAPTFPVIWYPLLEISQQNHSVLLFKLIERVVTEGSCLVQGYPPDPLWIRGRVKPHISGRKEYGWGDDLWMEIVSSGAAFLKDNLSSLPEDMREIHRMKLLDACNTRLKEWETIRENGKDTRVFKINGQIAYWKNLSGYFEAT